MRNSIFFLTIFLLALTACDKQTNLEKVDASKNNVTSFTKKVINRIEEKTCIESDLACLAEKAKNRTEENIDKIEDKAKETVDKLD